MNAPAAVYAAMYCELGLALTWTCPGAKGPRHPAWNCAANAITSPVVARAYWEAHPAHGIAALLGPRVAGKTLGRPPVNDKTEREIRKMLAKGTGKLKIARTLGVGVSTVQRVAAA